MKKQNFSRRSFIKNITSGTVGTIFLTHIPVKMSGNNVYDDRFRQTNDFSSSRLGVRLDNARLPILYKADVIIIGGSLAGVSAALELASKGSKVVLIEHRNYLGREIGATLRPWIDLGKLTNHPPEPFASCFKMMTTNGILGGKIKTGEVPLWMHAFKTSAEDVLLEAGVKLIYSSQPIGLVMNDGMLDGVIIGNKSGRQAILGHSVIDTSSTAIIARLAGGEFESETINDFQFVRTIEMVNVQPLKNNVLNIPEHLGITNNKLITHQGYLIDNGHIFIECPMELKMGKMDMEGMMMREAEARLRTMDVASYLIKNVSSFKDAKLGWCSYELKGAQTTRLTGTIPKWANDFKAHALDFKEKRQNQVHLSLTSFAGPVRGLWCLNEAARLEGNNRNLLLDPINSALMGASFAKTLLLAPISNKISETIVDYEVPFHFENNLEVKLQDSPERGGIYERLVVPATEIPVHYDIDFAVVGGGTSGATCASSGGREGLKTMILELTPGLGGTGTIGGVHAHWYGRYWDGFCYRNAKLVDELHEGINYPPQADKRNGRWNIECKMVALLKDAINSEVKVFTNTTTFATIVEDNKVRGVISATPYGPISVLAKVTADTTGDGDIAAFAGAQCTYGTARDGYPMLYNLAIYLSPIASKWHFMHTVDVTNVEDYTRSVLVGRRRSVPTHDRGVYIATRESRHIIGDTVISLTDMLRHRSFPDVINLGAGQMDCHRRIASDWIRIGLLIPQMPTEVPLRAITPKGLENILVGGKAFSIKHDVMYNMRNMPDLENLGGAMGVVAAYAIKDGVSPRKVNLTKVQKRLVDVGTLLPDMLLRNIDDKPLNNEEEIRQWVKKLDGRPLYDWYDIQMAKEDEPGFRHKIPIVEICTAEPSITIPILEQELVTANGDRQVQLAQALSMFGSKSGVPVLIAAIEKQIADQNVPPNYSNLPKLRGGDGNRRIPPVDLLNSLAMCRDSRSLEVWEKMSHLIKPKKEDFISETPDAEQQNAWVYQYVDSICYGAELLGDPAAIPLLKRIHESPLINNQSVCEGIQIDFAFERRSVVELTLGRALAHLGNSDGYEILISYLNDNRATLANFALMTLEQLTGLNLNKNSELWKKFLMDNKDLLKPIPLLKRVDG